MGLYFSKFMFLTKCRTLSDVELRSLPSNSIERREEEIRRLTQIFEDLGF